MTQHKQKQLDIAQRDANKDNIFFSVVIPLYNKERHIRRAVDSVLNQSYRNFELIVINDGSTDGSVQAMSPALDRLTLINQDNRGESAARNTGINSANYTYIAFLDADDEWEEGFLQSIKEMITLKPHCDIFSTNYFIKDKKHTDPAIPQPRESISEIDYFDLARKGHTPVSASSACVTAELFKEIGGFPEGIKLYPDLYFWTKAAIRHKFAFFSKPMATYHRDADNRACNIIVRSAKDTPFEKLIDQGEAEGFLSGIRLTNAREFICHYKLLNAFKCATQRQAGQARHILRNTIPITTSQRYRRYMLLAISLLPEAALHHLWLKLRKN